MKVVIIGGVAAGASAAARLRRLDETAEIVVLERSGFVSYANCGLPYFVGGAIRDPRDLTLQTPGSLRRRFRIDVRVRNEALSIDRAAKAVQVRRLDDGTVYTEAYDKLVLCPGAKAIVPDVPGTELREVYTLRTVEDALRLRARLEERAPRAAVVVGGGFIGLEVAENLVGRGVVVTIVEKAPQVMAPLDEDMAQLLHAKLREKGVRLLLGAGIAGFFEAGEGLTARLDTGECVPCDIAALAIGVAPDSALARKAGLRLGIRGAIAVDEHMVTSDPDICAAGDAVEIVNRGTGQPALVSLAGPANRQGRLVADTLAGLRQIYPGANAASVLKLFDLTVAAAGLNERALRQARMPFEAVVTPAAASHATYYPGAENMVMKTLFDPESGKLLGAQIVGREGVDKRIDVLATALYAGLTSRDLGRLDLSYSPPYSSAKDPVNVAGNIMEDVRAGLVRQWQVGELESIRQNPDAVILDVRTDGEYAAGHLEGSRHIPLDALRDRIGELDAGKTYFVHCQSGLRSYLACRILGQRGFRCLNLAGGYLYYRLTRKQEPPAEAAMQPCGVPLQAGQEKAGKG